MSSESQNNEQISGKSKIKAYYSSIRSRLLEVTEELKMRRMNDEENESKVNRLITEKFEIKRAKEEDINELTKKIENLKQEKIQLSKEFEEKMKMHEEDKATQNISLNSSSKGIKALKDEILAMQLSKHGLEKKLKDQEHQLQMEIKNKMDTLSRVEELQSNVQSLKDELKNVYSRFEYLAALVVKTEQMHEKLTQINQHHQCVVSNYQEMLMSAQNELTNVKAELARLKQENQNKDDDDQLVDTTFEDKKFQEMKLLCEQLETDLSAVREQKKFLMTTVGESNHMLSAAQFKSDELTNSNTLLRAELASLEKAKEILTNKLDKKCVLVKEIQQTLNDEKENRAQMQEHFDIKIKALESQVKSLLTTVDSYDKERVPLHEENNGVATETTSREDYIPIMENDKIKGDWNHQSNMTRNVDSNAHQSPLHSLVDNVTELIEIKNTQFVKMDTNKTFILQESNSNVEKIPDGNIDLFVDLQEEKLVREDAKTNC